jgi:hypothetical protein
MDNGLLDKPQVKIMNENDIAKKITRTLDAGLAQISDDKLAKLRTGRQKAMAQYREPINVLGLVTVSGNSLDASYMLRKPLFWFPILAIVTAAVVYNAMDDGVADDVGAIDGQLLTDELPINAFLDKDFQSWVKDSSR